LLVSAPGREKEMEEPGVTEEAQTSIGEICKLAIGLADLNDMERPARSYLVEAVLGRIADLAVEAAAMISNERKLRGGDRESESSEGS